MPNNQMAERMDELIRAVDEIFVGKIPSEDDLYGIHQVLVERRDAELARRSVTDDADVAEAIDDITERIEWECTVHGTKARRDKLKMYDLELQALRQYQKPKLCRLCNDEIDHEDVDLCSACINTLEIYQYQKPTDEAVQNMVQTFESFLSSRHDANWVGDTVSNQYLCDSAQVALRQMGSTEPCEWCVDKHSYSLRYGLGGDTHKHCANCGRKLKGVE